MKSVVVLLFAIVMAVIVTAFPAQAERRAFVVGVADYISAALDVPGARTANGARDVGAALAASGWQVDVAIDEDRPALRGRFAEFLTKLAPNDTVLFYYAGHGIEREGDNWLVLRDASLRRGMSRVQQEDELLRSSVVLADLVAQISARNVRHLVVIIDACREDPAQGTTLAIELGNGVTPEPGPTRSFTLYAASAGELALVCLSTDPGCGGDASPYTVFTRALLPRLTAPGVDVFDLARGITLEVAQTAETVMFQQLPAFYSQLDPRLGPVFLGPPANPPGVEVAETEREPLMVINSTPHIVAPLDVTTPDDGPQVGDIDPLPPASPDVALTNRAPLTLDELTRSLQAELVRLGCYTGAVDGRWGPNSNRGAANFARLVALAAPPGTPASSPQDFAAMLSLMADEADGLCIPPVVLDPPLRLETSGQTIRSIAFSSDGTWIAGAADGGSVDIWNTRTGELINRLRLYTPAGISAVAISPNGRLVAAGDVLGDITIWETATGNVLHSIARQFLYVWEVGFSADNANVSAVGPVQLIGIADYEGTVKIYNARTGVQAAPLPEINAALGSFSMSSDNALLASGDIGYDIAIQDLRTGQITRTDIGHNQVVTALDFSSDGTKLISGGRDYLLKIWDPLTAAAMGAPLLGHEGTVIDVEFSPDRTRIASGSEDNTAKIWDAATGRVIRTLTHDSPVRAVGFSPDGDHLATAADDGAVTIWDAR